MTDTEHRAVEREYEALRTEAAALDAAQRTGILTAAQHRRMAQLQVALAGAEHDPHWAAARAQLAQAHAALAAPPAEAEAPVEPNLLDATEGYGSFEVCVTCDTDHVAHRALLLRGLDEPVYRVAWCHDEVCRLTLPHMVPVERTENGYRLAPSR